MIKYEEDNIINIEYNNADGISHVTTDSYTIKLKTTVTFIPSGCLQVTSQGGLLVRITVEETYAENYNQDMLTRKEALTSLNHLCDMIFEEVRIEYIGTPALKYMDNMGGLDLSILLGGVNV